MCIIVNIYILEILFMNLKKRIEISFMADISRDKVSLLVKQWSYKLKIKVMQSYFFYWKEPVFRMKNKESFLVGVSETIFRSVMD